MSMHLGAGRSTSLRHVAAEAIISLRTTSTQDAMEARCHSSGCWFFTMMECWTSGREYCIKREGKCELGWGGAGGRAPFTGSGL